MQSGLHVDTVPIWVGLRFGIRSMCHGRSCFERVCTRWRAGALSDKFRGDSVLSYTRNSSNLAAVPEAGDAAETAARPSAEHTAPLIDAAEVAVLRREDGSEWLLGTGAHGKVLRQQERQRRAFVTSVVWLCSQHGGNPCQRWPKQAWKPMLLRDACRLMSPA